MPSGPYSPEPISTLGALAQVWDYHEAPLDFDDLGVPVNSPSAADNLGGPPTDLGIKRVQCVSTLTDQGVTLAARNDGAAPRRQKPLVVAAGRRLSLRSTPLSVMNSAVPIPDASRRGHR